MSLVAFSNPSDQYNFMSWASVLVYTVVYKTAFISRHRFPQRRAAYIKLRLGDALFRKSPVSIEKLFHTPLRTTTPPQKSACA